MTAPFDHITAPSVVATILSPGLPVSVQTRPPAVMEIAVPAAISRDGTAAGAGAGAGAAAGARASGSVVTATRVGAGALGTLRRAGVTVVRTDGSGLSKTFVEGELSAVS